MNATHERVDADLRAAAMGCDRGWTEFLPEQWEEVNAFSEGNVTPLHVAAEQGKAAIAALLLSRGADVNACTEGGWTALHGAAAAGRTQMLRLLLDSGADPDVVDAAGESALHAAARWGR